ncbi:hypothetical protein F4778DRAFT_786240 [Xylariomycetidae sp. FL2044]|nr:hypothetical protein F4778DRAFT_786240 [Xylariomycetidae sp. FL2044]
MCSYLFLVLTYVSLALAAGRVVLDRQTCTITDTYKEVSSAVHMAISRADTARAALEARNSDPNGSIDPRVLEKVKFMYGNDDHVAVMTAYFSSLKWYEVDNWSDQWLNHDCDNDDIVIFCNADYVKKVAKPVQPGISWEDTAQHIPISDNDPLVAIFKDPKSQAQAATRQRNIGSSANWPLNAPETILFHPTYLGKQKKYQFPQLSVERCLKLTERSLLDRIKDKLRRNIAVDFLATSADVVFHELTHTVMGGNSDDTGVYGNSYGWANCRSLAGTNNAGEFTTLPRFWADVPSRLLVA